MILPSSDKYNYHSHTQFCDGKASMVEMAEAAYREGMEIWGFSPHSPIPIKSPCNMDKKEVAEYLVESGHLKEKYDGQMEILTAMEVDFLSPDWGPHIDYFQSLPLDYTIGSVHFVPNQEGIPFDCDGRFERFAEYLHQAYNDDLRYVVEKFFEQELLMIERGGFEILGHFDKIAANASLADPSIEEQGWYKALVEDVIRMTKDRGIVFEINTKSIFDKNRFFPAYKLWQLLPDPKKGETIESMLNNTILINSDAHHPEKVNAGREEALRLIR